MLPQIVRSRGYCASNVEPVATVHPAGTEHGVVLATVKVWPVDLGVRGKVGAAANLDGGCARRHRGCHAGKDISALPRHRHS